MKYIVTGKDGLIASWQDDFPKTVKCSCGGKAYHVFTYIEDTPIKKNEDLICNRPPKELNKKDLWFHDVCAVANYACTKCLEITALNNQA